MLGGCGFHVAASARDAAIDASDPADGTDDASDARLDASIDAAPSDLLIEAESYTSTTQPRTLHWISRMDVPGYSGASFMFLTGGNGAVCPDPQIALDTLAACAP